MVPIFLSIKIDHFFSPNIWQMIIFLNPHLHALSDTGAGDLVAVWGPGGQRDTVNRPEKGGPGEDRDVPWGPTPH